MTEFWQPMIGYNDQYIDRFEISNFGRVRDLVTYIEIKPSLNADNYFQFFNLKGANPKFPYLHRLVALNFVDNDDPEHKTVVDHLDYNPLNNRSDNLEWVTKSENFRRAKSLRNTFGKRFRIRCVETGEIFDKYQDASDKLKIRYESIRSAVLYNLKTHGLHFERIVIDSTAENLNETNDQVE